MPTFDNILILAEFILKFGMQYPQNNYSPTNCNRDINVKFPTVEGKLDTQLISTASISHCLLILRSACCKAATTSERTLQSPAKTKFLALTFDRQSILFDMKNISSLIFFQVPNCFQGNECTATLIQFSPQSI